MLTAPAAVACLTAQACQTAPTNSPDRSARCCLQCYFSGADDAKALSQSHASSLGAFHNIAMNGQDVFRFAVSKVPEVSSFSPRLLTRLVLSQPPICRHVLQTAASGDSVHARD